MSTSGSRIWVVAGVVAALLMVAATWFLVIGPTRSDTGTLRDDTAAVQAQNETLVAKTDQLRAQAEDRDQLEDGVRTALATLPSDVSLPDFNRELARHAADRGVEITSITVGAAAAPAPAADGTAAPVGLLSVPIVIQSTGPALSQRFFLRDVQEVGPRAALVTSTSLTAVDTDIDTASTLTTQLTVFAASLSATDQAALAEVLGTDPSQG